jgi:pyrimidine-nucleoside phosphorylase
MRAVDIIRRKRDGHVLRPAEIDAFVHGATHRTWHDYQVAALLMAIYLRGMNPDETAHLTRAMTDSGVRLNWSDLPGPKVDKHSTGGVGDKTSLVLAPLATCCGVLVPMMSGRGLGHSGGTLDKLDSIPGFRHQLSLIELRVALQQVGCALIGQTEEIAPADRRLYHLRDVTATVESIPLITASILSKKIAEGISGLVMDVKCGQGAFMKHRLNARTLAQSLVSNGRANGVHTEALLTAMDFPLGRAVGNALEVKEAVATLKGKGPPDLESLSVRLAMHMLMVGKVAASPDQAWKKIREALSSGQGLEKFRAIVANQGGDPRTIDDVSLLPAAPHQLLLRADKPGFVTGINAEKVGMAAMHLGAGRGHIDETIDPGVGCLICAPHGTLVKPNDVLAEIHYRDATRLAHALPLFQVAWTIENEPPTSQSLILEEMNSVERT